MRYFKYIKSQIKKIFCNHSFVNINEELTLSGNTITYVCQKCAKYMQITDK